MELDVKDLVSGYGKVTVLHGARLRVAAGEIVVVLGPNGAGKTTLMKTVAGHLAPTSGEIRVGDTALRGASAQAISQAGIGYVPQENNVFADLSVKDNLRVASFGSPNAAQRVSDVYERFPILQERSSQRASTLSGGERQALAVSSALIASPTILLLDEPTAGLAPLLVAQMIEWIESLADDGMAVVWVVEQNPEKVLAASTRTYLLEGGRTTAEYESDTLLRPGRLQELLFHEHERVDDGAPHRS